jgi:hypothetical protein
MLLMSALLPYPGRLCKTRLSKSKITCRVPFVYLVPAVGLLTILPVVGILTEQLDWIH